MTYLTEDFDPKNKKELSVKYRLRRFRVTNFRSIIDSGYIDIKNHTTVLIGSNRAGKSSLLNALEKLNYNTEFEKFDLTQLGDVSFDYMNGKINGNQIRIIEAEFEPARYNSESDDLLTVTKFFDSSYSIKIGGKEYSINDSKKQDKALQCIKKLSDVVYRSSNASIFSCISFLTVQEGRAR